MAPRGNSRPPRPGQRSHRIGGRIGADRRRIGHAEWTAAAYRGLGIAYEAAGLPGRAESAYHRSVQAAETIPFFRAWAAAWLGALLARHGQPSAAAPHIQAALAGDIPLTRHEARWAQAELLAGEGDHEASRAAAAAALTHARHAGDLIRAPRLGELARRLTAQLPGSGSKPTRPPGGASTAGLTDRRPSRAVRAGLPRRSRELQARQLQGSCKPGRLGLPGTRRDKRAAEHSHPALPHRPAA